MRHFCLRFPQHCSKGAKLIAGKTVTAAVVVVTFPVAVVS